jgi:alanine-synthesizing transaminase
MTDRPPIPAAHRVEGFSYAIRNVVREAQAVEATGRTVRYLNIGDPVPFGFAPPPHVVAALTRALADGHHGYGPSPGLSVAREAVADDYTRRGMPTSPGRVLITSGASEAVDLALACLANEGDEVLVPMPTYPLYTAVLAKLGARARFYPCDPTRGWLPSVEEMRALVGPRTRAMVVINPNNPTGAVYPPSLSRAMLELAQERGVVVLADEVYGELAYDGPVAPMGSLASEAPVLTLGSLSKAHFAPGWRTGWVAASNDPRLNRVWEGLLRLADGRLCSPMPPQHAIAAALCGPREHQEAARAAFAQRAGLVQAHLNREGLRTEAPRAAFYAMPQVTLPPGRSDEQFVRELLHAAGILCVHGSGFGLAADAGFFRVVFLPALVELEAALRDIASFADAFRARSDESLRRPAPP